MSLLYQLTQTKNIKWYLSFNYVGICILLSETSFLLIQMKNDTQQIFTGYLPSSEVAGSYGSFIPSFLRNFHTVLPSSYINLHSHQQCKRVPFSPAFIVCGFFDDGHPDHVRWYLTVVLICISLMTSDVEHLFMFVSHLSEKAMAPHSSTLAWKIPWTEEPGRLQSMGSLGVGHTEQLGNLLQCSCWRIPAWWAAVYGVTQSRTRLKWLNSSCSSSIHLYVFFGEISVWFFFPFFDSVVCFSGIELYELFVHFGN